MNIIYAILLWMIGLKLGMSPAYYLVIIIGTFLQIAIALAKGGKNDSIHSSD